MRKNNWIELVGLPGVGKTTLVELHLNELRNRFKVIESRKPTLLNRLLTKLVLYGWLVWRIKDKQLARSLAYRLSFRLLESSHTPIIFYDSGIMQLVLEHFIENEDVNVPSIRQVIKYSRIPQTIFLFEDELLSICTRELSRGQRRFPQFPQSMLTQRYVASLDLFKKEVFPLIQNIHIVPMNQPHIFLDIIRNEELLKENI